MESWQYVLIWLGAFIAFLALEGVTTQLVSIWFAGGALAGLCSSFFFGIYVQVAVFLIVSIALLFGVKPMINKNADGDKENIGIESIIGCEGKVVSREEDNKFAQAIVNSQMWSVKTKDGQHLEKGDKIKVIKIQGVKLIVEKEK